MRSVFELRGVAMPTMRCPSCGETVALGEDGVLFEHVFRASGVSSMFHDGTLVHQCDTEAARRWGALHDDAGATSDRWGVRL